MALRIGNVVRAELTGCTKYPEQLGLSSLDGVEEDSTAEVSGAISSALAIGWLWPIILLYPPKVLLVTFGQGI
jgi:hypothetical protein